MSETIFITGTGIITAIGDNTAQNLSSLIHKKSGIGRLTLFSTIHEEVVPVCEIKHSDEKLFEMAGVDKSEGYSRTALVGLIAVKEALNNAGIVDVSSARTGLISATTVGGLREFETYLYDLLDENKQGSFRVHAHGTDAGEHTERIADYLGLDEYVSTISTACSSSANAIIFGAELIKNGILDRVICGGSDVLSKFTINGFNSLKILDKNHSRPFDASRLGVNLGEGSAYVVLESASLVQRDKKTPLAILSGYSNSNDAYHQTASSPDGNGAVLSMSRSIEMANLKIDDIDYINCHGTGTENNDLSETLAIQKLFGDEPPYFSSTKPYTGHTLAAAGSVEAIFSILAIQHRLIFPNLNFKDKIEEANITPIDDLLQDQDVQHVLSNSFGFGGSNTSLLFSNVNAIYA
jgi:3-oxoacyl-[acyl-carrier-protein] synthase-1